AELTVDEDPAASDYRVTAAIRVERVAEKVRPAKGVSSGELESLPVEYVHSRIADVEVLGAWDQTTPVAGRLFEPKLAEFRLVSRGRVNSTQRAIGHVKSVRVDHEERLAIGARVAVLIFFGFEPAENFAGHTIENRMTFVEHVLGLTLV